MQAVLCISELCIVYTQAKAPAMPWQKGLHPPLSIMGTAPFNEVFVGLAMKN